MKRVRRDLDGHAEDGNRAPYDQDDDHDGRDEHDLQGFFARLVNALYVFPPEIQDDDRGKDGSEMIL
jgi:hypothetical protein